MFFLKKSNVLPRKFIICFRLTSHSFYQHFREGVSFLAVLSLPREECRERQSEYCEAGTPELLDVAQGQGEDAQR